MITGPSQNVDHPDQTGPTPPQIEFNFGPKHRDTTKSNQKQPYRFGPKHKRAKMKWGQNGKKCHQFPRSPGRYTGILIAPTGKKCHQFPRSPGTLYRKKVSPISQIPRALYRHPDRANRKKVSPISQIPRANYFLRYIMNGYPGRYTGILMTRVNIQGVIPAS